MSCHVITSCASTHDSLIHSRTARTTDCDPLGDVDDESDGQACERKITESEAERDTVKLVAWTQSTVNISDRQSINSAKQ